MQNPMNVCAIAKEKIIGNWWIARQSADDHANCAPCRLEFKMIFLRKVNCKSNWIILSISWVFTCFRSYSHDFHFQSRVIFLIILMAHKNNIWARQYFNPNWWDIASSSLTLAVVSISTFLSLSCHIVRVKYDNLFIFVMQTRDDTLEWMLMMLRDWGRGNNEFVAKIVTLCDNPTNNFTWSQQSSP